MTSSHRPSAAGPAGPRRTTHRVVVAVASVALCGAVAAGAAPIDVPTAAPTTTASPATVATTASPVATGAGEDSGSLLPGLGIDLSLSGTCDELDPRSCLLPFPNDRFTVADASTDTGRRVQLDLLSMPKDAAGKPIDPTEWNRNDGFSPTSPILTYAPGLDLHATWGSPVDQIADLARYARPDAPIVLLDATTGQRHPFWSELDQHPGISERSRLLILRPAVQLVQGHRYIVALRRLRSADGSLIPASPQFRAYRDGAPMPPGAPGDAEARRPHLEQLFRQLGAAGIDRGELFLTWDFTIASERNLSERAVHIRDDAFASLGDTDLADRAVAGRSPSYAITKVTDFASGQSLRRVEGTITVPNYLTAQVAVPPIQARDAQQAVADAVARVPHEVLDPLKPVTGLLPVSVQDVVGGSQEVPGSRFVLDPSTGLPMVDPVQPTVDVPFLCEISRTSLSTPSRPILYGHGLLGNRSELSGGSTERLRERGYSPCGVDWWGMSTPDLGNVATVLADASQLVSVVDRSQQGFLNFLFLGRALVHPDGLTSSPAFRGPDGQPLVRAGDLAYDGNSQGSILGGAVVALAPDFERAVLGVPGMAFSTLLTRSTDWENRYAAVFHATYPDPVDQQLVFALMQMVWDRGEASGYAQHMTTDPLPRTPPHEVFLQLAFADHQVANITAEIEGRTIGASLVTPVLAPGLHWAADPTFGFRTVHGDQPHVGSLLVYWYSAGTGLRTPPNGNRPSSAGTDPHEAPRRSGPATDQTVAWLHDGRLVDVCHGPCTIPEP